MIGISWYGWCDIAYMNMDYMEYKNDAWINDVNDMNVFYFLNAIKYGFRKEFVDVNVIMWNKKILRCELGWKKTHKIIKHEKIDYGLMKLASQYRYSNNSNFYNNIKMTFFNTLCFIVHCLEPKLAIKTSQLDLQFLSHKILNIRPRSYQ